MIGWSQTDTCEWTQFFHANGVVSSEGCFVQGIPAGVWVSYSDEGIKLSEGQRFNNQPHGEWKFYSDGELRELAVFREGQREGVQVLWEDGMKTDSLTWVNNQIQGLAYSFYEDGSTLSEVPYLNGKKEGKAILYHASGTPNGFRWYKNDNLVATENFNRFDKEGRKTGVWKTFHVSGRITESGTYLAGLKHGVFRFFDSRENVVKVEEYKRGEKVIRDEAALPVVEIQERRRDDGSLEETVTYVNGSKQGVSRRFDESGEVIGGSVFESDQIIAEGITQMDGTRSGFWKEYWDNGNVRSEGVYIDGVRDGEWTFYRFSGEKEQQGEYVQGDFNGRWTWWYPGGFVHRKEDYSFGELDGEFIELDPEGQTIVEGAYEDDLRMGFWTIEVNGYIEKGEFLLGEKDGEWIHQYPDGTTQFKGEYSFGQPVGRHRSWHPNGAVEWDGSYENGTRHKKWRLYDEEGFLQHEYLYKYGKLRKVDGSKVDKRRDG